MVEFEMYLAVEREASQRSQEEQPTLCTTGADQIKSSETWILRNLNESTFSTSEASATAVFHLRKSITISLVLHVQIEYVLVAPRHQCADLVAVVAFICARVSSLTVVSSANLMIKLLEAEFRRNSMSSLSIKEGLY